MSWRKVPCDLDAVVFEIGDIGVGPRQRDGGGAGALGPLGDQRLLPLQALELPDAQPQHQQHRGHREDGGPEGGAEMQVHGLSRVTRQECRVSPERCLYCSAIMIALAGRSKAREAPRINGPQSSIWTQIGGREPDLRHQRQRHHQRADDEDDEDRRAVGAVGAGQVEPAAARKPAPPLRKPWNNLPRPQRGQRQASPVDRTDNYCPCVGAGAGTEEVDADEEEQPDHVDEMPVPGRGLEAEMMVRLEMTGPGPEEADDQEGRADDDVEAVEARRHEEGRGIDAAAEVEGGMAVFDRPARR